MLWQTGAKSLLIHEVFKRFWDCSPAVTLSYLGVLLTKEEKQWPLNRFMLTYRFTLFFSVLGCPLPVLGMKVKRIKRNHLLPLSITIRKTFDEIFSLIEMIFLKQICAPPL